MSLILSREVLDEYRRVGVELAIGREQLEAALEAALDKLLTLLAVNATIVNAPSLPEQVCEDPDDGKVLAVALAGRAPIIVSSDKHRLRVSGWQNVEMLKPRAFVDRYIPARDG